MMDKESAVKKLCAAGISAAVENGIVMVYYHGDDKQMKNTLKNAKEILNMDDHETGYRGSIGARSNQKIQCPDPE